MSDLDSAGASANPVPTTAMLGAIARDQSAAGNEADYPTCGGGVGSSSPAYVYVIGSITQRFPQLSIEKEFAQRIAQEETTGLTHQQAMRKALMRRENRYLARQLCWVMTVQGLETYILVPRDPADIELLIEAMRAVPEPSDIDVAIGARGPLAPPTFCNGLTVPVVAFDQIYSFDADSLLASISPTKKAEAEQFKAAAKEVLGGVIRMTDNAGAMDEHRALNYLAVRYPGLYTTVAEAHAGNASLSAVEVRPSRLSGTRRIMEVILSFTHRMTGVVEKQSVGVDVTEEFPFLVTKMARYFDR